MRKIYNKIYNEFIAKESFLATSITVLMASVMIGSLVVMYVNNGNLLHILPAISGASLISAIITVSPPKTVWITFWFGIALDILTVILYNILY